MIVIKEFKLSVIEPFTSPAWGSNIAVFGSLDNVIIDEDKAKDYITAACKYAKQFGVYLVPERFILLGYQSMCLISPEGKVITAQRSAHINYDIKSIHTAKRGSSLEVSKTELGNIFLCVDVDIYYPEMLKIAKNMGAHFVICSQYLKKGSYSSLSVTKGAWNASQSNKLYVLNVTNEYNCICAPREITKNNDGFVITPNIKTPMTATLSAADIISLPVRYPLSRKLYLIHKEDLIG